MSDRYKLVFRGEVLEGQHPAVVRKRLAEAGNFNDAALEKLFSGQPVVVKREADTATAARIQGLFKQAGARLRLLPVQDEDDLAKPAPPPSPEDESADAGKAPSAPPPGDRAPAGTNGFDVLPAGSDMLREDEREPWRPRDVDTGDLALEGARFAVPESTAVPAGPDVSHITVADVGTDLGPRRADPENPVQPPDYDLADAGADLGPGPSETVPAVDVSSLDFEVAPAGEDLGQLETPAPPGAPDTSHIKLAD